MSGARFLFACLIWGSAPALAAPPPQPRDVEKLVVTSQDDGSISEIDPKSDRVVKRVKVGNGPAGIAAAADGHTVVVTHPDHATIDVIDVDSGQVFRTLVYEGEAFGVAVGATAIYVSDWAKHVVARLDFVTGEPTASVAVGKSPAGLVIDAAHHRLYAANRESDDVSIIDSRAMRVVATVPTGAAPFALALSPDGERLYVANVRDNDLAVIDTQTLHRIAKVPAGAMPYGVAVTSDGGSILVTNQHGNTLSIIDAKSLAIVAAIPVGRYPEGVTASAGRAYVANWFSGDVSVVDLTKRREIGRIKVGDGPRNFARVSGSP